MIILDLYEKITKTGPFATFMGIADTHFLIDTDDTNAYQPLDHDAYQYFKHCNKEMKDNPKFFGKPYTFTGGDLTELHRSSVRKAMRVIKKNDCRAEDSMHKAILSDYVVPKVKVLTDGTTFIGGVAGNHMIEFSDDSDGTGYKNSEAYIIQRLGGKYCGEGLMLINYHIQLGNQRCLKKIIIMHGTKGGSKTSIMRELANLHNMCGKVDWLIKCHAHDPLDGFYCRYDFPDEASGRIKKHECLVTCLGSTRDGVKKGYDDYSERFLYSPSASRFPVGIFYAHKPSSNNRTLDVKIRPLTM